MLAFSITGGRLKPGPGVTGYLYKLHTFAPPDQERQQQGAISGRPKIWKSVGGRVCGRD
jgi:hypothetical protein